MPQDGSAWVRFKVDLQAGRQKKIVESRFLKLTMSVMLKKRN